MNKAVSFAVCDDDELVCETICNKVNKLLSECGIAVSVDKYVSPVALYRNIESGKTSYDALFLDIDMPKISGIELAKAIRKFQRTPDIIFVSNREDRVFDSLLNVRPFGFVRKNNFTSDLVDTLRAYVVSKIDTNHYFIVKTDNNSVTRSLRVVDIVYIESFKDHQFIYMQDGEKIDIRMTMDELEKELTKYDIVRTHKGYLVNLKYVQRIDAKGVTLPAGVVGLSRTKVQEVKAQYLKYLRKTGASLISN